jgi:cation diffusion facilitator CzcD-associated flavoprotein CzcO
MQQFSRAMRLRRWLWCAAAIVLATGFGAKAPLTQFNITAGGVGLLETLKFKPESLYGTAIAGYPNMFTLLGLNTGLEVLASHSGRSRQ